MDICNIVKEDDTKKWLSGSKSVLVKDHQLRYKNYVISNLEKINKMFGIGLPTTCGYSLIYEEDTKVHHIYGYFIHLFSYQD